MDFRDVPAILSEEVCGPLPPDWPTGEVSAIEQDSRAVDKGALFVCIPGTTTDGRAFLADAVKRGAGAAFGRAPAPAGSPSIPYLTVRNARRAAAIVAARYHRDPSHELKVVGVTGTNGKTTTTWLLRSMFDACGTPSAVVGTLGTGPAKAERAASHTTPDAPRFQRLLRSYVDQRIGAVAVEVSSHALDQERTYATRFSAVVFTNLTRDHLDYHKTEDGYRDAKRKLFHAESRGDASPCVAVMNLDDPASEALFRGSTDLLVGFGRAPRASVRLHSVRSGRDGLHLEIGLDARETRSVHTPLLGEFNAWNVLAAYATARALDLPLAGVERALAAGVRIPGRMERVEAGQPFLVVVDYAHTPDALARALVTLRPFATGALSVVFGCGGDRDRGKRPLMGAIAAREADRIYLTSDNPRTEDPQSIIDAILGGVRSAGREADVTDVARESAIRAALTQARQGDLVLIAGKGHEDYQEDATGRRPLDDREVARRVLLERGFPG